MNDILKELGRIYKNEVREEVIENDVVQQEYSELNKQKDSQGLVTCTVTGFKKSTSDINYFMVTIENCKRFTGLVKVDDVIRVEIIEIGKEDAADYIGRRLICRVKEVFEDTLNVILSRDFDDVVQAIKTKIDDTVATDTIIDGRISKYDMKKLLEVSEFPIVDARIVGFVKEASSVAVDIYELGLRGRIPLSLWDWSYKEESEIIEELKELTSVQVAVVGYTGSKNYKGRISYFICSKIIDPEEDIFYKIEKRFTQDSMIVVECVGIEDDYFWGRNDLFEGDIMCYYDDFKGKVNTVKLGERYLVRVKKVSERDRRFTCSFVKKLGEGPRKSLTEI